MQDQVPHLTQDTNGKVTNSQLDTTNESQEVSPFPAGDHKAHVNRRAQRQSKNKTEKYIKDPQKSTALEQSVIYFTGGGGGLNLFNGAPTSPLVQMWIKTHRCLKKLHYTTLFRCYVFACKLFRKPPRS